VPVVLKPGVEVKAADVLQYFVPAAFNPDHVKYIARWENAKEMAVNMYSAFWTLCVCVAVTVGVSLFTRPKPDAELKNLVFGLTPLPDEGPCPWYQRPVLWAAAVAVVLVAINVIFW
jgi:SSS family solute:Na+ symporter